MNLPKLKKVEKIESFVKYKIGDTRNGQTVLPKNERKRILLLSDDLRFFSGVATQSKEFVLGTCHHYNWLQIGAGVKHPEEGKRIDLSRDTVKETGVEDAEVVIIGSSGYGNQHQVRELLRSEKIDGVMLFTDPRYFIWLWSIEHEIRQMGIPIFYYNIWDDTPAPMWNEKYYKSCDLLMGISKQTYQINKAVLGDGNFIEKNKYSGGDIDKPLVSYVPHGIDTSKYFPITEDSKVYDEYTKFVDNIRTKFEVDEDAFVLFWNNRNIRRKNPGDLILAYKTFCDSLPKEEADKCVLILHTDPVDDNGTDLPATKNAICPDYKVIYSDKKSSANILNFLYNFADVTLSIASNEGFGLSSCESLHAGTPIVVNVTGGLQDQCGFKKDGKYITEMDLTNDWMTNSDSRYGDHGEWVNPVYPRTRSLKGSPLTPYIFDDTCDWEDVAQAIKDFYNDGKDERQRKGLEGNKFATIDGKMRTEDMSIGMMESINLVFDNWVKPSKWKFESVDNVNVTTSGITTIKEITND